MVIFLFQLWNWLFTFPGILNTEQFNAFVRTYVSCPSSDSAKLDVVSPTSILCTLNCKEGRCWPCFRAPNYLWRTTGPRENLFLLSGKPLKRALRGLVLETVVLIRWCQKCRLLLCSLKPFCGNWQFFPRLQESSLSDYTWTHVSLAQPRTSSIRWTCVSTLISLSPDACWGIPLFFLYSSPHLEYTSSLLDSAHKYYVLCCFLVICLNSRPHLSAPHKMGIADC